jgi:hypothetical protein
MSDGTALLLASATLFSRLVLLLTFALSLTGKIGNVRPFASAIASFRIVPRPWARGAAWLFLAAELAVIAFLIAGGRFLWWGTAAAAALLLAFTTALLLALVRRLKVPCHCFGNSQAPLSVADVARNVLLVLCAFGGLAALHVAPAGPALPPLQILLVALGTATFATFCLNLTMVATIFEVR